jgi:hypothetical protein
MFIGSGSPVVVERYRCRETTRRYKYRYRREPFGSLSCMVMQCKLQTFHFGGIETGNTAILGWDGMRWDGTEWRVWVGLWWVSPKWIPTCLPISTLPYVCTSPLWQQSQGPKWKPVEAAAARTSQKNRQVSAVDGTGLQRSADQLVGMSYNRK